MYRENIAVKSINFIFKDIIFDILYWPIWWYSIGLAKAFGNMKDTIAQGNRELALGIWVKNLFVPMFGQTDWQGRLISFFMRLVQIIIRFVAFLFWIVFAMVVFLFWPFLPLVIVLQVLLNLGLFGKLW